MPRILLTIVLPLLLPTALYLLWVVTLGPDRRDGPMPRKDLPWVWLAGAGVVLLAVVLLVATVGFGTSQEGVYVPPRWENGRIIPGHIEPKPGR